MSRSIRSRRTAEQWQALIAEQAQCGLSQSTFCKRKQLALSTFSLWKRRLSEAEPDSVEQSENASRWIDLGNLGSGTSGCGTLGSSRV